MEFIKRAKENQDWVEEAMMKFIMFQNERAKRGEISAPTIPNYYKTLKLFCEMNKISVSWRIIIKGMTHGRNAANDRAPTKEEIRRLCEYHDPRIKPIVYVMCSSGIRLGAWDDLKWKHVIPVTNG